jgi:hypothetical protein
MTKHFSGGRALVIGIANYAHANKLPQAVLNDARDFSVLLQSTAYCSYPADQVNLLLDENATADRIRTALVELASAATDSDTVVIFFSGHGGRFEEGPHAGTYLIPSDFDPACVEETAISGQELTSLLAAIRARRVVIILDACHAGGVGDVKSIVPIPPMKAGLDKDTYDLLAKGVGRVILASSRVTEASLVLSGMANSLFTHFILEAMRGAAAIFDEDVIRIFNVFDYASKKVPEKAAQNPIFKAHDLENNFPLALNLGGKQAQANQSRSPACHATAKLRLSGEAWLEIKRGLFTRWEDVADYLGIPTFDRASFEKGKEPQKLLQWLEERGRLGQLRQAFDYLNYDDLLKVLNDYPG